jgi:hypothetical protein
MEAAMSDTLTMPALAVVHEGSRQWAVRATWPDGHFEEVSGFPNEQDANDWITNKFQDWLVDVEKARSA